MDSLLEAHYFPCVQYFSKVAASEKIWIERCENYQKGSYRNRCHITGPNGLQILSVPLRKGKHQQKPVTEVQIAYDENWHLKHYRAIKSAYGNSPYFSHFGKDIANILDKRWTTLYELNLSILETLLRLLNIEAAIMETRAYKDAPGAVDQTAWISPGREGEDPDFRPNPYLQVFSDRSSFQANLSVLDVLFCLGPEAGIYLADTYVLSR
jgi:hypothetical protein